MGGCGSSSPAPAAPTKPPQPVAVVDGTMVDQLQVAPAAGHGGYGGKAKGKGKGKGRAEKERHWQIKLDNKWEDYKEPEDGILKRAFMLGHPNARFHLRGQDYEYNFKSMKQKNRGSGKQREIRPPLGFKPPKKPLLPQGPMTVITVRPGQAGTQVEIPNPNNPGQTVKAYVPAHAKPGQKLAIPLPAKGESVDIVQQKQQKHDANIGAKTSSWSTGGKVAAGGAAVVGLAAVGVGGVILGDHLAGGDMAETIGEAIVDAGEAVGDGVTDAIDAVGDWAPGAFEDVGDWAVDAVDDIGDWLGDAGEDIGDFVMDLF